MWPGTLFFLQFLKRLRHLGKKNCTPRQTTGTLYLKWNVRTWPREKTSEWLKTFDVFTNQKHTNSSPANAKAWWITRLLKQPYSSLYTCNPYSIPDVSILKDPNSRWHWSFTLTSPPAPNPADSPYIWNALRSWYTIRYIVGKKMFLKTFLEYICSGFSLQMSYVQGLYQCHVDSLSKVNPFSVYSG